MKQGGLSERIMKAFNSNIKEQKALEKTIQAIGSEETYSMKLLELSNRETQYRSARLRRDVAKIRSNLSVEEICELQSQEKMRKLRRMRHFVKENGGSITARADGHQNPDNRTSKESLPKTDRSKSEAHIFSDQDANPRKLLRSQSAMSFSAAQTPRLNSADSNTLLPGEDIRINIYDCEGKLSSTKAATARAATATSLSSRRSAFMRSKTSLGFSSHNLLKSKTTPVTAPDSHSQDHPRSSRSSRSSRSRSSYNYTDDIMSPFHSNEHQQVRCQELLEIELNKSQELKRKQMDFLNNVSQLVEENAKLEEWDPNKAILQEEMDNQVSDTLIREEEEEEEHKTVQERWDDLRKIRYLRVSDEITDLSGVVTLVMEQKLSLPRFTKGQHSKLK